jgi:hypothetical protein
MPTSQPEPSESFERASSPAAQDQPAERGGRAGAQAPTRPMAPGDEAPAGSPGTGEDVCPACGGSGRADDGGACTTCAGAGTVTVGIGGA